jgi:radial spoke head protein 1
MSEPYDGEYNENGQRHGQGKVTLSNGDTYEGLWKDGMKHGDGRFDYASGDWYTGTWDENIKHGPLVFHFESGDTLAGKYHNNEPAGQALYTSITGSSIEADWVLVSSDVKATAEATRLSAIDALAGGMLN